MGLIKCPDCGNMVSDSAFSCPKCGRPMRKATRQDVDNNQQLAENSKPDFPEFPLVLNPGKQIVNWKGNAALQDCTFIPEENVVKYIAPGKCDIYTFTNGICIKSGLHFFYICFDQIVSLKSANQKQLTTVKKSVVGRAVVGDLILGPLGAIVGGMSGIGSKTKLVGKYYLIINFWDVYSHSLQSIMIASMADPSYFIGRVEEEKTKKTTPEGNNYITNVLDDNGNVDEEKLLKALSEVGESTLANNMACVWNCGFTPALQRIKSIGSKHNIKTSQYKSSGCLVTLALIMTGLLSSLLLILFAI